jgi:uncharacterized repeat protein (TIGR01451 family)
VRFPGALAGADPHLISSVDVAPTFADLAGATPDIPVDGVSLAPLLRGDPPPIWRDSMLIEHEHDQSEPVPGYRGVRTTRYLYAEIDSGERELYDTAADPYELQNRAGQPAYAAIQAQLAAELRGLLGADLQVSTSAAPPSVPVNGSVTLTVEVKNLGPGDASGVVLYDAVPAALDVASATSTVGSCDEAVHCAIGSLSSGGKATVTIVATTTRPGTFDTIASVSGAEPDPDAGNDAATASVTVEQAPRADLSVTIGDAPDPVAAGDTVAYTARIANGGPNVAQNVTLSDPLPAGATLVALKPGAKCSLGGGIVSCSLGSMAAGGIATVVVTVRVPTPGSVTNTVSVASTTADPDTADRSASAGTTVTGGGTIDLRLTGSATPNTVVTGGDTSVTWGISDAGTSAATDVTFTHALPDHVTLRSVKPGTKCAVSGGVVTCSFGRIDPGSGVTVTEILRPTAQGTVSTTAQVARAVPDDAPGDESATVTISVSAARVVSGSWPGPSPRGWAARREPVRASRGRRTWP